MKKIQRVELHLHTNFSALDALTDIEELFQYAAEKKYTAVAVTDHGTVQAFPEIQQAAKKYGVKAIYGVEAVCFDEADASRQYHITLLVKNRTGLKNLYRLLSYPYVKEGNNTPQISKTVLEQHRTGLLVGSACARGELFSALLKHKPQREIEQLAAFYDYIEIQPICNHRSFI